jgi:subtilisin family serine protease
MNLHGDPLTREAVGAATGAGVRILVADSGVDCRHPALGGATVRHWGVAPGKGGDVSVRASEGGDRLGHGTAVASIIRTLAPDCELDSLQVLGGTLRAWSETVLAGLCWGIDQGYDIINCSFATSAHRYLAAYKHLVDLAFCRNVLLVAACSNADFRRIEYPSAFPTVLATDCGKLEGLRLRRRRGHLVEFVASGDGIRVAWTGGQWREVSGSSFAAPHLTACAARIRQLRPDWNACQVKAALYAIADTAEN